MMFVANLKVLFNVVFKYTSRKWMLINEKREFVIHKHGQRDSS